jgi:hypothetical protein
MENVKIVIVISGPLNIRQIYYSNLDYLKLWNEIWN